jgi:hypothetical protein
LYNLLSSLNDFLGLSLVMFAVVIGFGVLTGETQPSVQRFACQTRTPRGE